MTDATQISGVVVLRVASSPENVASVRRFVSTAASRAGLTGVDLDDLLTAVDEAAANAVRHGSPHGADDTFEVYCKPISGGLEVEVRDHGGGFSGPICATMPGVECDGGRGLPLMCALSDSVDVSSSQAGSSVRLSKVARRHAQ